MFDVNFNYDDFLKGQKSELIKKVFLPLYDNVSEAQSVFTNDNMESISKEISFEYFMKNSDIQDESTALKLKECQNTKQETKECSKLKLDQCEKILAYEDSTCINLQIHMRNIFLSMKKKSINKARVNNYINISQNKVEEIEKPKEFNEISLLDMTPTYIQNNFDSTPKTHWEPMKPVLLANFEKNIGEQLKDISALAR